jgi:ribonuclease HI
MTGLGQPGPRPEFLVHIDGSSKFNPGPAGAGVVISRPDGSVVKEISHSLGTRTNNQAEYDALVLALQELRRLGSPAAEVRTDSQLLYCQVTGRYRVRHAGLKPLYERVRELLNTMPGVRLALIRRDDNRQTDRLARRAAEAATSTSDGER